MTARQLVVRHEPTWILLEQLEPDPAAVEVLRLLEVGCQQRHVDWVFTEHCRCPPLAIEPRCDAGYALHPTAQSVSRPFPPQGSRSSAPSCANPGAPAARRRFLLCFALGPPRRRESWSASPRARPPARCHTLGRPPSSAAAPSCAAAVTCAYPTRPAPSAGRPASATGPSALKIWDRSLHRLPSCWAHVVPFRVQIGVHARVSSANMPPDRLSENLTARRQGLGRDLPSRRGPYAVREDPPLPKTGAFPGPAAQPGNFTAGCGSHPFS